MRCVKRTNISRISQTKKFQRTCWSWPRTSWKPNLATSSLRRSKISTTMDAVLQSVAFRPPGYASAFDRHAAEQRATLSVADRVELEDLVAQLSTDGAQLESHAGPVAGALSGATKSKRVEIDYVIDHASRSIRIIALRHGVDSSSPASLNGSSHA